MNWRVRHWLRRPLCGLFGHPSATTLEIMPGLLVLRCHRCGWLSRGWNVTPSRIIPETEELLCDDCGLDADQMFVADTVDPETGYLDECWLCESCIDARLGRVVGCVE